jgi:hypothetical protein
MRIPFGNEYAYGVRSMHGIVAYRGTKEERSLVKRSLRSHLR